MKRLLLILTLLLPVKLFALNATTQDVTNSMQSVIFTNIVTAVQSENTNELFSALAGTSAANGHWWVKQRPYGTDGFWFTNFTGTGNVIKDLCGNSGGTIEADPFYCSPVTNNNHTLAWYFSQYNERFGWTNVDDNINLDTTIGASPCPVFHYGTNITFVTNSVLIQTARITGMLSNCIVLVDSRPGVGNDIGAAKNMCPYQSLTAAQNRATNGWLIVAYGVFTNDYNLGKNLVDWQFQPNSQVGYDVPEWMPTTVTVFQDTLANAITSNITGDLLHYSTRSYFGGNAIQIANPSTRMTFNFNEADVTWWKAPTGIIPEQLSYIGDITNCAEVDINIAIQHTRNAGISNAFVIADMADPNYGKAQYSVAADCGYYWEGGTLHNEFTHMTVTNRAALAGLENAAFWSHVPASVTNQTHWYIEGHTLEGFIYANDDSFTARVWWNIFYQEEPISCPLRIYGNSLYYPNGSKAFGNLPVLNIDNPSGNGQIYARYEKWQSPSGWVTGNSGGTNLLELTVQNYNDSGSSQNFVGFDLQGSHGSFYIDGHDAFSKAGIVARISSGVSNAVFQNIAMYSGRTNAIEVNSFGLTLQNTSVTATNGQWAIKSLVPQHVRVIGATTPLTTNIIWDANNFFAGSGAFTIISAPTNTANYNRVTTDLIAGGKVLARNQRFSIGVSVSGTAPSSPSLVVSNAGTGVITTRSFSVPTAAVQAETNSLSIEDCDPNSFYWVTNGTVVPNTTAITYK